MKANPLFSTLLLKVVVAITGLLLCGFLAAHLAGNVLLYVGEHSYNAYAHALHENPLLPAMEVGLLAVFLVHVGLTLHLHAKNKAARPESYEVRKSKRGHLATTASNIMHVSGLIVLAFVVLHLIDFRFDLRMPGPVGEEPAERTLRVLHDPITASVYVIGSLLLGYHLLHGFLSAFQSLGVEHPRAVRAARVAGIAFAALVAVGFASFPLWANLLK